MTKFEKIFEENKSFIYKFLLKFCKDSSIAEELTQETFFRAYMNIASLKNEDKASVWLCQIAKNTYFAWYNENKKILPLDETQILEDSPDVVDLFTERELSKKALVCLHQLDEPYKEVFMLSVLGDLSLKDISNLFGKSESWARVTFYRAKQKLIERMRGLYGM